ncbi:MAG: TSUP family transporter [Caryophanon sp.]|nr:TSUP family transporter [Caryophanon sp.]
MDLQLDGDIILLLLCFGFLAAFIDSVVGGGGLIALPALLFTGMSPATALATNKLAGSIGSATSTFLFFKSGNIDMKRAMKWFPLTFFGSMAGALTVHFIDPDLLKPLMLFMLAVVAVYTIVKKDLGSTTKEIMWTKGKRLTFLAVLTLIGFYDGFLGPGTGSFFIFAFVLLSGMNFLKAAGNAKLLNFGSNIGALLMFFALGHVAIVYGLIMGAAQIVGSVVGTRFALKYGSHYVRILFIIVTCVLLAKNFYDYFIA